MSRSKPAKAAPQAAAPAAQQPRFVELPSADAFLAEPQKSVCLIGMSGVGKTTIAKRLRAEGNWFHYSVDFRIGTRYMGEHIVDSFKQEAMRTPMLRELLMTDSIYIVSNISFENLSPLATYLGKPGAAEKGGLDFDEYLRRQRQHRAAEEAAMRDSAVFIDKARRIYGYDNFLCDASGSLVEVAEPADANDPVLRDVAESMLLVFIRQAPGDAEELARRFDRNPKPMYYNEMFLKSLWRRYLDETGDAPDRVDPDAFVRWGFRELLAHRTPRYQAIADGWGVTIEKDAVAEARDESAFTALIAEALDAAAPN